MTAPPRDPYEWVDTKTLDPEFYRMVRGGAPRVLPQRYTQGPTLVLYRMTEAGRCRQRVLDQAVRRCQAYTSHFLHEVAVCPICVAEVRAEFQRLWREQA